jgi:flagellar protein FlaG
MTTINQAALGGQSQVAQTPAPVMSSAGNTNLAVKSDAQVVAAVVTTPIKPSGVLEASQPSREVVAKAAEQLQSFVQSMGRNLSFSVDEVSGYNVVRVVNPDTGELIRQLPSEELLKISRDFQRLNNALVSQRA